MDSFKKSILIVEDETIIAEDLADIIISAGYRVGEVTYSYDDAMAYIRENVPDLVLLDINLNSGKSGLDLARLLRKEYQIPFIFLTSYADQKTITEVVDLDPQGYLVKPYKQEDIITALALAFSKLGSQQLAFPIREELNNKCNIKFSKQEYKVITHMMKALSNKDIADIIFVSVNTVKSHIANVLSKLDVHSKLQAVQKINDLIR